MEDDSSSKRPVVKLLGLQTPLLRLRSLGKVLGFDGIPVYLKYEGVNPTGTHKDRAARAHVARAVELGMDTITVGTCGNYGVAISYFARQAGLRSVVFVPKSYENSRVEEMKRYGARVVFVDGSYEEAVELSSRAARANGWYDANPGTPSDEVSFEAYSAIAGEIVSELGDAPYAVAVPVGNGTTLAGIYLGFLRAYREGEATRIPRLIAGTTALGNQIAASWRRGSVEPVTMSWSKVKETPVNEPLVAYKSLSAAEALEALVATKGRVYEFSDEELVEMAMLLRVFERVSSLPASASSVLALKSFLSLEEVDGPLVAVITGRWRRIKH
ncbi:pyridoxal-phosphate dependent enzyme [Infirmifilum lucidum]|uniref:Pyridoxal-phosphate dependent enzyme n=1 Tax=Infirmifilum lucidum TaxID=2776706 RepID=A0A7L9FG01_9CREN|nr:pyridoxal-phosphate dependent enzyme [Infirmifilum lucidum]QOJ78669.1 pyridoxal-phosphate dependent enzyme [Infirmifilum lucidum]